MFLFFSLPSAFGSLPCLAQTCPCNVKSTSCIDLSVSELGPRPSSRPRILLKAPTLAEMEEMNIFEVRPGQDDNTETLFPSLSGLRCLCAFAGWHRGDEFSCFVFCTLTVKIRLTLLKKISSLAQRGSKLQVKLTSASSAGTRLFTVSSSAPSCFVFFASVSL